MNCNYRVLSIVFVVLVSPVFTVFAQEGHEEVAELGFRGKEGGGTSWIIDGDNVSISDPHSKSIELEANFHFFDFKIQQYLFQLEKFLETLEITSEEFWNHEVRGPNVSYILTSKDISEIECEPDLPELSEGYNQLLPACTNGNSTWLFDGVFNFEGVATDLQGKTIFHERLHGFSPRADHDDIRQMTVLTDKFFRRRADQLTGTNTAPLTRTERIEMEQLFRVAARLGFSVPVVDGELQVRVLEHGALLVCREGETALDCFADIRKSFIAMGSKVTAGSLVFGSRVLNSNISGHIINSTIEGSVITDATISDSSLIDSRSESVALEDVVSINSTFTGLSSGTDFFVQNATVSDSTLENPRIAAGDDQRNMIFSSALLQNVDAPNGGVVVMGSQDSR